jgi:solute carrier family 25 protein 38
LFITPHYSLKSRQQYAAAKTQGRPPGGWALATTTVKTEGVLALWNGLTPSVLRTSLGVGVQFTVLDHLLRHASSSRDDEGVGAGKGDGGTGSAAHAPGSATVLSAGGIARAISCAALHPMSIVKVRMESYREHRYTGALSALRDIARTEGFAGLYAGLGAALLRDVPYSAAYIFFYQQLLSTASRVWGDPGGSAGSLPFSMTFAAGLTAGLAATCISHPFDVIKTRLQLDRLPQPTSGTGALVTIGCRRPSHHCTSVFTITASQTMLSLSPPLPVAN